MGIGKDNDYSIVNKYSHSNVCMEDDLSQAMAKRIICEICI